jgi:Ca2+-binding RTX toxin-like protein
MRSAGSDADRAGRFTGGTVESLEQVQGAPGNDTLIGSDEPELLQGAGGADTIAGLGGAELLVGDGLLSTPVAADAIDGGPATTSST